MGMACDSKSLLGVFTKMGMTYNSESLLGVFTLMGMTYNSESLLGVFTGMGMTCYSESLLAVFMKGQPPTKVGKFFLGHFFNVNSTFDASSCLLPLVWIQ